MSKCVRDMPVAGFTGFDEKRSVKEQMEIYHNDMPSNHREADKFGSRLNHKTGQVEPRTAKDQVARLKQFGTISKAYLDGYAAIRWDD